MDIATVIVSAVLLPFGLLNALAQYGEIDLFAWRRYFIEPLTPFSKEFLEELERCNREKPNKAPLALVLQAEADYNGAFSSPASHHLLLQIAKTHRIVIKMIETSWFWGRRIREAAVQEGRPIDLLCVRGHGQKNLVQFGNWSIWNFSPYLRISQLAASAFSPLAKHAFILLDCCNVGQALAARLAKKAERTVLASKVSFDPIEAVFRHAEAPELLIYGDEKVPLTYTFLPDGSESLLEEDEACLPPLFQEKLEYVQRAAEKGDRHAEATLARMYRLGKWVEQSDGQALHWYRRAAAQGDLQAQYMVGAFYRDGLGEVDRSDEEALHWFRLAADQGHLPAMYQVGRYYGEGLGGLLRSEGDALRWYQRAADEGDCMAQFAVGGYHFQGRAGLEKSEKEAFRWFRRAAKQGLAQAAFYVGLFYKHGLGGEEQSPEKALKWLRRAADQGYVQAQYEVGLAYERGSGIEKSDEEALRWYRRAAGQCHASSERKIGIFHHRGRGGLPRSYADARFWYALAADRGESCARYNLGFLHEHGLGGLEPSDEEALRLYRLSADEGFSYAQFKLSEFYREGRGGLAVSPEEAKSWMEKIPEEEREEIRLEIENLTREIQDSKGRSPLVGS